jgi:oxygen-independent coproporphyrinogen III oxidase
MAFGIYIHIPYCLQLCPYCDFTKYEWGKTLGPDLYTNLVRQEIRTRASGITVRDVSTVYFGGGTPSLLEPAFILSILEELEKAGFRLNRNALGHDGRPLTEISIEIDPATVDEAKLDSYLAMGINRFSVGAQSFNDRLLKIAGRKHTAQDTVELLSMLKRRGVNYSFDLLFALPSQTLEELGEDVSQALQFGPSHISAYCLTVPEGHKMDSGRALEEEQIEMFHLIEDRLRDAGIERYEVSNFAKPGFESRHNSLYWADQPYWGIGLSSHSYLPASVLNEDDKLLAPWGARFWNKRAMKEYEKQVSALHDEKAPTWSHIRHTPDAQIERLKLHQSLTDFMHTSLRPIAGLDENALRLKFGDEITSEVLKRLEKLSVSGWVAKTQKGWAMTREGRLVANIVFEKFTFLEEDIAPGNAMDVASGVGQLTRLKPAP